MTKPDIQLEPGQTVVIPITNHLEYRITHTGWFLKVVSTKPIGVAPVSEKSVNLTSLGSVGDDEV